MKKTKLLPLIFLLSFLALSTLIVLNANTTTTKTTVAASPLDDVQVDQVDHAIKILDGGSVAINDTVRLSAKPGKTVMLTEYSLGFPYIYKARLAYVYAFNTSNPLQMFNVSLDTSVGGDIGFYGVTVVFSSTGIQLFDGSSFRFTVAFIFSNIISSSTRTFTDYEQVPPKDVTEPILTLNFPMYPSLPQNVSLCNITIALLPQTSYDEGSFPRPPSIKGSMDDGQTVNITRQSLEALSYSPGWMNFTSSEEDPYRVVMINEIDRKVSIDSGGNIFVTDEYTVTSQMQQIVTGIRLSLPKGASNVSAYSAQGDPLATPAVVNANTTTYSISFGLALQQGQSTQFKLTYSLPSSYLNKVGTSDYDANLPISKGLDRVAEKLTFEISLPEGASIKEYPNIKDYALQKDAFQEKVSFTAYNVSLYNNLNFHMVYAYSVFWASFRPTLWMAVIVAIAVAVALVWQAPKALVPSPLPKIVGKPQTLRAIISSYEEKTRTLKELESIDRQAQKGRLPRRRYKIRKRMLESQLSRLDRELVDLKQKVKSVGPRYVEILRELDIAEAEMEGVEAEIRRVEARYRSGALTLDAYRRLLDQYNKRKEKTRTIIEGALLRLSEGIT